MFGMNHGCHPRAEVAPNYGAAYRPWPDEYVSREAAMEPSARRSEFLLSHHGAVADKMICGTDRSYSMVFFLLVALVGEREHIFDDDFASEMFKVVYYQGDTA